MSRVAALWLIAGYTRPGTGVVDRLMRAVLTLGRALDFHGRVATNGTASCLVRSTHAMSGLMWGALSIVGVLSFTSASALGLRLAGLGLLAIAVTSFLSAVATTMLVGRFPEPISHVLADLVRAPKAERGSGAALTTFVLEHAARSDWLLGGRAANEGLVERFYEPLGFVEVDADAHLIVA